MPVIFAETPEDRLCHIQEVFNRLRKHGLKLKLMKCSFVKEKTDYLRFIIKENGVTHNPKKVNDIYFNIKKLSAPNTVREVCAFIVMCSYCRFYRFIPIFILKLQNN